MQQLERELKGIVGDDGIRVPGLNELTDATDQRGLRGTATHVAYPTTAEEVRQLVELCYAVECPITPRGGGTGLAGGAVPNGTGIVLDLSRLDRVRSLDSELWRAEVEAGVTTADFQRRARENGLYFPPDPGASESSTIGGNIATNAGGPHSFRHGVTGDWLTGIEVVLPPGELLTLGGPFRKDAAGLNLKDILVGSEGILGIVTAAWTRLIPAPEVSYPVAAVFESLSSMAEALRYVLGTGIQVSALEYIDEHALAIAASSFPGPAITAGAAMILADAEGSEAEGQSMRKELIELFGQMGRVIHSPEQRSEIRALWEWRDGVSLTVAAHLGGKISEDVVVPLDRLEEAIREIVNIGQRYQLSACSWGHAGDGNLHATFLVDLDDRGQMKQAAAAEIELFEMAERLGGSISGEHGIGVVKREHLLSHSPPRQLALMRQIKQAFDPKGLLNPGKLV